MEWSLVFKSVFALMFVIGLMFVCIWIIKYFQANLSKNTLLKRIKPKTRIKIVENKRIDIKNSVVLIEADHTEFLVLLSSTNSVILSQKPVLCEDTLDEI